MDDDDDDDTVVGTCLHCSAPPPPRSSSRGGLSSYSSGGEGKFLPCSATSITTTSTVTSPSAATRVQVSCDDCRAFICDACHWCHEFQANHEIRVCDRCDAFYCRGCDEMDQCEDCSEVVCNTCSTLMSCKFCGCGLCEDCATACGRCGIVLCARDAKFAVECDTCRMPYCLVCLASGTKDPCVRCGHRPSKRMEQLVHLRLKSIYKAFKQSGASDRSGSGGGGSGGSGSSGGTCRIADGSGRDGPTMGGKYSSALRSLTEGGGGEASSSKDNFTNFDQSMASEVAAVLQTASNSMAGADGDDARRARGKRLAAHDHSPAPGGSRHRSSSRASNAAAERYFRKTQAEMEAAAAAAEAEAEAAAAALLAELDEERVTSGAAHSKKSKKKKKKKERKKEAAAEGLPPAESVVPPTPTVVKDEPKGSAPKEPQKNPQKKKGGKKALARRSKAPIEEDSSDEDFEQLVRRPKTGTRPSKKEKKEENSEAENKTVAPPPKSKAEPPPPVEAATTAPATTADFDAELAILLSNEDEEGLQTFLANLKGVPGLGAARKTAKKAIKRIKEARQPPAPPEEPEPLSQPQGYSAAYSAASHAAEHEAHHDKAAAKTAHSKQGSRAAAASATAGTLAPNLPPATAHQHEPLLRVVSRTQSNVGTVSSRGGTSNSTSVPVSARAECVMHMSPAVVGWVIGKGGSRIRDMMEESGAKIWIDQESMGVKEARVVYVSGKRSSVDAATRMVKDLVSKAPVAASAGAPVHASFGTAPALSPSVQNLLPPEAAKEPTSFAAAIGSGVVIPAAVTPPGPYPASPTKQAAPTQQSWALPGPGGIASTVPLQMAPAAAPQCVRAAPSLGIANALEAGGAKLFPDMLSAELVCDPRFVALLIGRRGWTVKNIQAESGADLHIDQSMDPPKIIISGKAEDVKKAERMVRDVLKYPQAQLHQQSSQQQSNNDMGVMNGTSNIVNGTIDNSTRGIHNMMSDKHVNPPPLPLPTSLHREVSSSTPKLLEELQFQQDSSRQSRNLHAEGAMNLPTGYPQYQPQQNQSSLGLFQDSSPVAGISNFLPNHRHQSQPPPVNVDPSAQNQTQEWGHHNQAPAARPQYSTLPPFTSVQDSTRDQYLVSNHNAPLAHPSSHNDSRMPSTFALPPPEQHHHFSQNLDPVHQAPMPPAQVSSTRINDFMSAGGSSHNVNGWELPANGSSMGERWEQQNHQQSMASTHQQTSFQAQIAPSLSNNPFQHQAQNHLAATSSQPTNNTNNRVSDDSLMVDNMFASLGTSSRDGDGLLSALNSVSLGGAVSRRANRESKISGWASEGSSSFLGGSRLGGYREE